MTKVDKTKKQPLPPELIKGVAACTVLFAGMMTGVYFLAKNENKPAPKPVAPASAPYTPQGQPYVGPPSPRSPTIGYALELEGPDDKPYWTSVTVTLDDVACEQFAPFAPVELVVPETGNRWPLPVQDYVKKAKLNLLNKPVLEDKLYHCLIMGVHPQTKEKVVIAPPYVINPKDLLKK